MTRVTFEHGEFPCHNCDRYEDGLRVTVEEATRIFEHCKKHFCSARVVREEPDFGDVLDLRPRSEATKVIEEDVPREPRDEDEHPDRGGGDR